jgi:uncharacterized protein (TIGR02118 family)
MDGKENRMIKINVMYPYTEGARFDHAYYRDRHMPMVKSRLGSACAYYTVEKGLAGRAPGAPPAFVAMCAFLCDSAEGYQAAMQEHGAEIRGDIANYTDIAPVVQVSERDRSLGHDATGFGMVCGSGASSRKGSS